LDWYELAYNMTCLAWLRRVSRSLCYKRALNFTYFLNYHSLYSRRYNHTNIATKENYLY